MLYSELRQNQKELAVKIREARATRKDMPDGFVPGLKRMSIDFRHNHIAYCLLRGRSIKEIESKTAFDNAPDMNRVKRIMESIEFPKKEALDEKVVCDCTK